MIDFVFYGQPRLTSPLPPPSFTFIKNIPARSEQYKPSLRDIPPKMRSTPNGTLVLDLVGLPHTQPPPNPLPQRAHTLLRHTCTLY